MAIQFIDNQPLTWRTDWPTDSDCKTPADKACTVYSTNDYLFAQWKQTPCGVSTNKICNPDLSNSNPDMVTNGEFDTNANGWTLDNTQSTYDAANKRIAISGSGTFAILQNISAVNGTAYDVTFTIGGVISGSIEAKIGSTAATAVTASGTYTQTIVANGSTLSFKTIGFDGWIDDISVKENIFTGICWGMGNLSAWQNNGNGSITKIPGSSSSLSSTISNFQTGGYYKLTFKISGTTNGSLGIEPYGLGTISTITADGYYEFWFTAIDDNILFNPDIDFNGTISDFDVRLYSNYYTVILKDTKNNTQADLSGELELYQDWVTIKYQLGDVDPGCYELCVYDACGYSVNDDLITDYSFADNTKWTLNNTYPGTNTSSVAGGKLTLTAGTGGYNEWRILDNQTSDYWPAAYTTIVFDYTVSTGTVQTAADLYVSDKSGNYILLVSGLTANTTYNGSITIYSQPSTAGVGPQFRVYKVGATAGQVIEILEARIVIQAYIPGQMAEYCSNCIEVIDYPDADKCTLWVGGTNGADAFGFHFDPTSGTPFQVGARVRAMLINPKYTGDHKRYTTATGKNIVTASSTDKVYTLLIDYTDEHTHDWLRIACLSDTLRIGPFSNTTAKYVGTDGDYSPEWPDNIGNWPAAQARVEVIAVNDTLYNNNAG